MTFTSKFFILRLLLCAEVVAFATLYFYGSYSVHTLTVVQEEAAAVERELQKTQCEVDQLEHELKHWKNHNFYKEKVAREKLQMARTGDIIYYVA